MTDQAAPPRVSDDPHPQLPKIIADRLAAAKTDEDRRQLLAELTAAALEAPKLRYLETLYPETGPLRRELYPRHMEFFRLSAKRRTVLALAANRVGKTEGMGGYSMSVHLTGRYPPWWEGKRFDKPIRGWASGKTGQTTRDTVQRKLLGPAGAYGTMLIPKDAISLVRPKQGLPDAVDTVRVKHVSGGESVLTFKSNDQGRQAFEGDEQHVVWLDEEHDESIYGECVIRTMTTDGVVMMTFTPLKGMTPLVKGYLEGIEGHPSRGLVKAGWDDVPHLGVEQKAEMLQETPPHLRAARSMGEPTMGSGAIYPIAEDEISCDPFEIPKDWKRVFGLDVGWNRTAAVLGAESPDGRVYITSEYYRGQAEPSVHIAGIRAWGDVPGVIDPASKGRTQRDGLRLIDDYSGSGLEIYEADNAVEAGLQCVWDMLSTGRMKVFRTCLNWFAEYRLYHRDESGKIVKRDDHLMDATRYLAVSGLEYARPESRIQDSRNWTSEERVSWAVV